jgi:hypothetical protein
MGSLTDYERGFLGGLVVGDLMLRGAALKRCLNIFDSLNLDRWCPHVARRYEAMRTVAIVARTRPPRTVS